MARSNQFLDYVLEQLQGLERLISRRMFGGAGLYSNEAFFGLIYKDRLYFRTDEASRQEYEARGGEPFRPRPKFAALKSSYYTVPADVLEDSEELVKWARTAAAAAVALQAEKATKKTRAKKDAEGTRAHKKRAGRQR
jgi:DNA transformation protein